jgi:hypothetical protein
VVSDTSGRVDASHERQPDEDASSDGDRSWTADPTTVDPDEDRSVETVVRRTAGRDRDRGGSREVTSRATRGSDKHTDDDTS